MLELLNQLDGFDSRGDVKVIMATNRIETLDPALIRPGRIDRKIEFPLPDIKTKRKIFQIHTGKMTLAEDVNLEEFIHAKDDLSGADIKVGWTTLPSCEGYFPPSPGSPYRDVKTHTMVIDKSNHACGVLMTYISIFSLALL